MARTGNRPLGTLAQRAAADAKAKEAKLAARRARRKARREEAKVPAQPAPPQRPPQGRAGPPAQAPSGPAKARQPAAKLPPQPAGPPVGPTAPKSARKPTPQAPAPDPFDLTPTPATLPVPAAYLMRYASQADKETGARMGLHPCLAYMRTADKVFTIVLGPPVQVQTFDAAVFDAMSRPLMLRLIGEPEIPYPLDRAIRNYAGSYNGHTDKALRVLKRLKAGRPPDEEDTIEDLLDMTPSVKPVVNIKVKRQARSTDERLNHRRSARQAKLAAMAPKEREEWKKMRRERRKERRELRKGLTPDQLKAKADTKLAKRTLKQMKKRRAA